jgi:Leucine-rich repeat (LRR) protein
MKKTRIESRKSCAFAFMFLFFGFVNASCNFDMKVTIEPNTHEMSTTPQKIKRVRVCTKNERGLGVETCSLKYFMEGEVRWVKTDDLRIFEDPSEFWMPFLFEGEEYIEYERNGRMLLVNGKVKTLDLEGLDAKMAGKLIERYKKSVNFVMFSGRVPERALKSLANTEENRLNISIRAFSGERKDIEDLSVLGKRLYGLLLVESELSQSHLSAVAQLAALSYLSFAGTKIEMSRIAVIAKLKKLRYLSLERSEIDDYSLTKIRSLPLLMLNLKRASIRSTGIRGRYGFNKLKKLVLFGTKYKRELHASIIKNVPNVEILIYKGQKDITPRLLGLLPKYNKLKKLKIWGESYSKWSLSTLKYSSALEHISLANGSAADIDYSFLTGLEKLRVLQFEFVRHKKETLRYIGKVDTLKELLLHVTTLDDTGICYLRGLHRLKKLSIGEIDLGEEGLRCMSELGSLRTLDLFNVSFDRDKFANIVKLKNVRVITLDRSSIGDWAIRHLAALPELRALSLARTKITGTGVQRLNSAKKLRSLSIAYCPAKVGRNEIKTLGNIGVRILLAPGVKVDDDGIAQLSKNRNIVTLDISDTNLREGQIEELAKIETLKHLICDTGTFGEKAARAFSKRTKLESLLIHGTIISDKGLESLSKLPLRRLFIWHGGRLTGKAMSIISRMKNLSELQLRGASIDNKGLGQLCQCRNLWFLDLRHTNVNDIGLSKLACLQRLRVLRIPEETTSKSMRKKIRKRLGIPDVKTSSLHSL